MTNKDYTQYVNTNIGTIGHLLQATAPSVQSPHGAAIAEPVFRAGMKDRYLSDKIFGFAAGSARGAPCAVSMRRSSLGSFITPPLAIEEAISAICSGVVSTRP